MISFGPKDVGLTGIFGARRSLETAMGWERGPLVVTGGEREAALLEYLFSCKNSFSNFYCYGMRIVRELYCGGLFFLGVCSFGICSTDTEEYYLFSGSAVFTVSSAGREIRQSHERPGDFFRWNGLLVFQNDMRSRLVVLPPFCKKAALCGAVPCSQ